jgi:hypothetical protein
MNKNDVQPLIKQLDPRRLMIETSCASVAEAEELLAKAKYYV